MITLSTVQHPTVRQLSRASCNLTAVLRQMGILCEGANSPILAPSKHGEWPSTLIAGTSNAADAERDGGRSKRRKWCGNPNTMHLQADLLIFHVAQLHRENVL